MKSLIVKSLAKPVIAAVMKQHNDEILTKSNFFDE